MSAPSVVLAQAFAVALQVPVTASAAAQTYPAAGVDLQDYEGVVAFILQNGAGQTVTGAKLTHSDTSGGTYTDVSAVTVGSGAFGGAASTVSILAVNVSEVKRWVRFEGTTAAAPVAITMLGFKKYR